MLPSLAGPMPPRKTLRPTPHVRLPALQAVKLLDQLRERIRYLHYSRRTEEAYVYWVRAFIRCHGLRHPAELGGPEVEAYLTYLAGEHSLAPSSSRQALSALLLLYGKVLGVSVPWMNDIGRPQVSRQTPLALLADEIAAGFAQLMGEHGRTANEVPALSA
jgi:hypothetical protein